MKKPSLLTKSEEALIFYVFSITMMAAVPGITDKQIGELFQEWPEKEKLDIIQFSMLKYDEYKETLKEKR